MDRGAPYDGMADTYETFVTEDRGGVIALATETLLRLLGPGRGRCLDMGCGGGRVLPSLAGLGWTPVGIDASEDQLRVAMARCPAVELVRGDAAALPFADGSFEAAVSLLTHTDLGDFPAAIAEVWRVLRPGGRFVYVGNHPCFVGPTVEKTKSGIPRLYDGYRRSGWWTSGAPGASPGGLRAKLGRFAHWPLGVYLDAFAGFRLEQAEEPGGDLPYPALLALAVVKP